MSNKVAGYVATLLVIVGAIISVVRAFDDLEKRVTILESKETYIHGDIQVPRGGK